jgi:hypothetical protein
MAEPALESGTPESMIKYVEFAEALTAMNGSIER